MPQRRKVNATKPQSKVDEGDVPGFCLPQGQFCTEMVAIFYPGFPTEINLSAFLYHNSASQRHTSHIIVSRNLTKNADSQAC